MSDKSLNISSNVMSRITTGDVKMRPRWYFVAGSLIIILGLAASVLTSIFLISLTVFSLRTHGPMGSVRFDQLISAFPWWAPPVAILGLIGGILLMRKYDFSYRKNFGLIIAAFVIAVIIAGYLTDITGLDTVWAKKGVMQRFYLRYGTMNGVDSGTPGRTNPRGNGYGRGRQGN